MYKTIYRDKKTSYDGSNSTIVYGEPNTVRLSTDDDLIRRQREHLEQINGKNWSYNAPSTCLHDNCPECIGTGIKKDGSSCIHMISCLCPKCSPQCSISIL